MKTNKCLRFLLPYLLFCVCHALIQPSVHHLGISTVFLMFVFWLMFEDGKTPIIPPILQKLWQSIEAPSIRKMLTAVGVVIAVIPILYSGISSGMDIRLRYGARELADFLKDNGLEDRKIMISWRWFEPEEKKEMSLSSIYLEDYIPQEHPEPNRFYTNMIGNAATMQPYFDRNIFTNFNADDPETLYMRWGNPEDYQAVYDLWHDQGLPEVLVGYLPIDEIFSEEELEGVKYYWVAEFEFGNIFKLYQQEIKPKLYIREDVLEEYPQIEIMTY